MFLGRLLRTAPITRYVAYNGALAVCAWVLVQDVGRMSLALAPSLAVATGIEPSRVEKFKQAEIAAAQAPKYPVPRLVVARSMPEVPVQVLAVKLDQAESIKVKPLRLKKKSPVRMAKLRHKKPSQTGGKLPPIIVELALGESGLMPEKKFKKKLVLAESSRDITNRSLGVLVASTD